VKLIQKRLVANVQAPRRWLPIPIHFVQSTEDQFLLRVLDGAGREFFQRNACRRGRPGRPYPRLFKLRQSTLEVREKQKPF
jgi:hypothetical protein